MTRLLVVDDDGAQLLNISVGRPSQANLLNGVRPPLIPT